MAEDTTHSELSRIKGWHMKGTRVTSRNGLFSGEGLVITTGVDASGVVMAEVYTAEPSRPFVECETRFLEVVAGDRHPTPRMRSFTVLVRGQCQAAAEIPVMAKDAADATRRALFIATAPGFKWEIGEVEGVTDEGVV